MDDKLEIRTLGGLSVHRGGRAVSGLASRKAEALLVYLASRPQAHSREALATLLWDNLPSSRALANLSVLLSSLRKQLAPFLTIGPDSVSPNPDSKWELDAAELRALIEIDAESEGEPGAIRAERAAELYRGDFLEGFYLRGAQGFEEWAVGYRERLRHLVLRALHQIVEYCLRSRQFPRGLRHAQRLLELDPLAEAVHRQAMILYVRQREPTSALEQYASCRRILHAELGIEPSFETTALYHQVLAARISRPPTLPTPLTAFVAREDEVARIAEWLADPEGRLMTLVGPGGVGKTRLALEAATRLGSDFLHGACFVPLAALDTVEQIVPALAEALQFTFQPSPDARRQLLHYLRERETLLVLDSFEHLVEGVDLLSEILAGAPQVRILATSRTRPNVLGQWVLEVGGLPYPEVEGPTLGQGYGAVDLFVQGARRVQAEFELSQETESWILRICRRVEGLPLALEIAAAWTRTYSVERVAAEIERSLDFLSGPPRELPERQPSLRAVFEHTWGMLNDAERTIFRRLSVFRGSFPPKAALFVAGASQRDLAGLVDKSLLHRTAADRYSAHEVVRVYGIEKAAESPEDRREVQSLFRSYYTEMLALKATDLTGPRQGEAVAELGLEAENLRSAWSAALEQDEFGMLERSADGLFRFYMIRGRYQEGADAFGAAALRLEETEAASQPSGLLTKALVRSGAFLTELSHYERAKASLDRGKRMLEAGGDREELAFCLNRMGTLARKTGALSEARLLHTESLALARQVGFLRGVADSLSGLGSASYLLGEYEAARESYRGALEVFQSVGDQQGADRCLINLANIADREGAYEDARELLARSLSLSEEIGDRWGVAAALNNMGNIALKVGQDREARRLYEESLAIKRQLGNQEGISSSLDNLGRVAFRLSEMAEAKQLREASLAIRREIGDTWGVAYSLNGLGDIATAQGQFGDAVKFYREAIRTAIAIQAPLLAEAGLIGWAELLWRQGERDPSLEIAVWIAQGTAKDKEAEERAVRLRDAIAGTVGPAAVRQAEGRIRSRSLEEMAAAVLGEDSAAASG